MDSSTCVRQRAAQVVSAAQALPSGAKVKEGKNGGGITVEGAAVTARCGPFTDVGIGSGPIGVIRSAPDVPRVSNAAETPPAGQAPGELPGF